MAVSLWCGMMLFSFITHSQMTAGAKVNVGYSTLKGWLYNGYGFGTGVQQLWDVQNAGNELTTTINLPGGESWLVSNQIDIFNVSKIFYIDISAKPDCNSECKLSIYVIGGKTSDIPGGGSRDEKIARKKYFDNNSTSADNATFPTNKTTNQTFQLIKNKEHKQMYLAIAAKSAAVWTVYDIQMYYYYCGNTTMNQIQLSRVEAPASGFTNVTVNCSANAVSSSNKTSFLARCYANGTWETDNDTQCKCLEAFGNTATGCSLCPADQYKSNTNCAKCPNNRTSNVNKTNCECEKGYHSEKLKDSLKYPCYGLPSKVQDLEVVSINETSFNITWNKPSDNGGREPLIYEVECYCTTCDDSKHLKCENKFKNIKYTPGNNMSTTRMIISGLEKDFKYNFTVYSKHSFEIDGSVEWKFAEKEGQFETEPPSNGSTVVKADVDNMLYIIIGAAAGLLLLIILVLIIIISRSRRTKKRIPNGEFNTAFDVALPTIGQRMYVDPTNYDDPEAAIKDFANEISAKSLVLERVLGGGEFGDVYKGKLTCSDGAVIFVAAKTLKHDSDPRSRKGFLLEASAMGQFDDPNVIRLQGVITKSVPHMIITEYMSNGSLDNFLKQNDEKLTDLQMVGMARGVASGMKYLAAMNFVHRDLAARNILINDTLVCKVADFGLSRVLETADSSRGEYCTSGGKIPVRWTAPEAIKYRKFSTASDVWSYGILLWEIMTFGERPYWDWDNFKVMERVDEGFRMPLPKDCPKAVHDLMLLCWNQDRSKRPPFLDIVRMLDEWIRSPETIRYEKLHDRDSFPSGMESDPSTAIKEWLNEIKMSSYIPHFTTSGYKQLSDLSGLLDNDLKSMGITLVGHRNKMLRTIRSLPITEDLYVNSVKREKSLRV